MKRLKCNIGEYGVIMNSKNEFLILRLPHNKEFTKEMWMFPGGRLDFNDQPEEGLIREVKEETTLRIKVITPVHTARWGIENPPKYSVFYICALIGKSSVKISDEHLDYKWIKFREIDNIPWNNKNSKIAALRARGLWNNYIKS